LDLTVCSATNGRLVITDHALISVQTVSPEERPTGLAAVLLGGVVGAALAAKSGSLLGGGQQSLLNLGTGEPVPPLHHMNRIVKCFASEVPPEVAEAPRWPKLESFRPVTFYPRTLIGEVKVGWTGQLVATFPGHAPDFTVRLDIFSVPKARAALRSWGYPIR
jgi:hypothetical protein